MTYHRNERLGHGFTFEDGLEEYLSDLKDMSDNIYTYSQLSLEYDLIIVLEYNNGTYKGINFKYDGSELLPWICPEKIAKFEVGGVYALEIKAATYNRLSPFIHLTPEDEIYLFKDIEESLTGKIRYNQLLRTGSFVKEWEEISNFSLENDKFRRKSVNGTIISLIEKNYKHYIEVRAIKRKVSDFLLKDRASVCATIWGHGGVGKTATVQSICEDFANDSKRFDYIVFVSAKDRYYNYYTGSIEAITENVNSFEDLIKSINRVVYNDESNDPQRIIETKSKVLIIIDDYETFPQNEKDRIEEFIRKLDINHHKVLVTTRANLIIGDEFQTNELNEEETISFLLEILRSEFGNYAIDKYEIDLQNKDDAHKVYEITSGRPLFIYQFAYIWLQVGNLRDATARNIGRDKTAIEFLYGRIFEYLSPVAKNIFVAMGQVVTDEDLTNLIEKVRYILNLENDGGFDKGIRELEKLRIIEIIEARFFRVYSREILQIMISYFVQSSDSFRGSVTSRLQQVTRDKKLDNENALLSQADTARTTRNEEEVRRLYRHILNRDSSPYNIKLRAILNLSDYLFNNRGKQEEAVKLFKDYELTFQSDATFIKMYATYSWAIGQTNDSIRILLDFLAKKSNNVSLDKNIRYELLGLLLMYRAIDAIQQREYYKEKKRYGEISESEYLSEHSKGKRLFIEICENQGKVLFNELQKDNPSSLSSGARQNIITGLYQLVNVYIRLNRFHDAIEVCEYVLDKFPTHFSDLFKSKLTFLRSKV